MPRTPSSTSSSPWANASWRASTRRPGRTGCPPRATAGHAPPETAAGLARPGGAPGRCSAVEQAPHEVAVVQQLVHVVRHLDLAEVRLPGPGAHEHDPPLHCGVAHVPVEVAGRVAGERLVGGG